jgi:hypothetical protein
MKEKEEGESKEKYLIVDDNIPVELLDQVMDAIDRNFLPLGKLSHLVTLLSFMRFIHSSMRLRQLILPERIEESSI